MSENSSVGQKHPYHLVDPSPLPFLSSIAGLAMAAGLVFYMHYDTKWLLILGTIGLLTVMFLWWRDVVKESTFQQVHTPVVELGLRYGMALFIASEVMFFVAFFWAFFDASLTPKLPIEEFAETFDSNGAVGVWPPEGIKTFDPLDIPFLNTLILLMSGTTCTWAHHAVREGHRDQAIKALWLTVGLGVAFTLLQAFEYYEAFHHYFKFTDGIYPSVFYMATGFHGFHVMVGTAFLAVCLFRVYKTPF
jgi:cytochrome c oxidase subunit 3